MNATSSAFRIGFLQSPVKSIGASQQHLEARLVTRSSCFVPRQNLVPYKPNRVQGLVMWKSRKSCIVPEARGAECGGGSSEEVRRKRLAIFISGGGSNFRAIHEAIIRGSVHGDVAILVTDKPGCGGAEYARNNGIPVILFPKSKSLPEGLSSVDLVTALRTFEVDFLLLAGYLKLIPIELVQAYPRSILNIHPSLLPAFGGKGFYGMKVHRAVIASGARYSGPTVHFVDEHFDTGLILAQRVVPVLAKDTPEQLAARVLLEEHQVYAEAVTALCEERIIWREDGVPLIRSREHPDEYC